MDKHLELVECNIDEQEQVDGVFLKLIDKVMTTWETQMDRKHMGACACVCVCVCS